MFDEYATVVLARDLPEHRLTAGDMGSVVHIHAKGEAYEVEFVTGEGLTAALVTLCATDIRPMAHDEIPHVREIHKATG